MATSSPWLRLCALAASGATLLAVISGAASLGAAHQLLSALALPPLVAVAVAAWLGHRELVVPSLVAIGLFGLAARLRHADEAADHVAAPADRHLRDVRRRRGSAAPRRPRCDDGRPRARLR